MSEWDALQFLWILSAWPPSIMSVEIQEKSMCEHSRVSPTGFNTGEWGGIDDAYKTRKYLLVQKRRHVRVPLTKSWYICSRVNTSLPASVCCTRLLHLSSVQKTSHVVHVWKANYVRSQFWKRLHLFTEVMLNHAPSIRWHCIVANIELG